MSDAPPNLLYYGDNLDILRRYVNDESVDLVYLDPPFNSNADYNVLFAEKSGEKAQAQITAFEDTWEWGLEAAQEYAEVLRSGETRVAKALKGMHDFLGGSDMMAESVDDVPPPHRAPPRPQAHRQHLPPLRPDRIALPQDRDGRGVRAGELSK